MALRNNAAPDKPLDRRQSLKGVPVLNERVEIDTSDDAKWVLTVTIPRKRGLMSRFLPPNLMKRFELDELGTDVLRQIDGRHTVQDIVVSFREKYKVNRREAELSVAEFMKTLIRRQVIAIAVK